VIASWRQLRSLGLLGINRRNASYSLRHNPRHLYPLVDDKLQTKDLCRRANIPTPGLLSVAHSIGDLTLMMQELTRLSSFVLKPARGAMGNGIIVISAREGSRLRKPGGSWLTEEAFRHHASGILSGLYALGGQPDVAVVEERLMVHPELAEICHEGVPDYRVIVFLGVPIMAMARLPTRSSGGRANLHHGAVGVGIDLSSGLSTHAVIGTEPTKVHPDTGVPVVGRAMPGFDRALEIAVAATDLTGLGYVGADVVVDADRGPMILELNARPGLAIQIANRAGLEPRLREIERVRRAARLPFDDRLKLGRRMSRRPGEQHDDH